MKFLKHFLSLLTPSLFFGVFLMGCFAPQATAAKIELGLTDDQLLEKIQRYSLNYFLAERDKNTGMVRDRAHNFKRGARNAPSSIAATGFALTVYPIAVERGWLDYGVARKMVLQTLHFFLREAEQEKGFFYHFIHMKTGKRMNRSELSPIDTALLIAGALFAAEYFEDPRIRDLANQLYSRIDWPWMLNGGETLALAWSPEGGFHKQRWDHYSEHLIMYLLAIGSPTHPIPASSWDAISRPVGSYKNIRLIQMPPLFTHQYSHMWIDFRNKNDGHADYFQNSVNAAKANRAFCMDQASQYQSYGPNSWGLTASDGPFGYKAYGAPPGWAVHDGTIAPTGCGSSIVFTPKESKECLRYFYEHLGEDLWGLYGFADSFNLDHDWFATDVIGIDQGALIIMIENYRSGLVWQVMKKNIALQSAMDAVGFKQGTIDLKWPDVPRHEAPYVMGGIQVDGYLNDWPSSARPIVLDNKFKESGTIDDKDDLNAEVRFAWDEEGLYFAAKVRDQSVLVRKSGKNIWMDDLLELYIDPQGDGLIWEGKQDYQVGVRAVDEGGGTRAWSWFQGGEDPIEAGALLARSFVDQHGYLLEGMLRWNFLKMKPYANQVLKISPAIHDIDPDRQHTKVQWHMRHQEDLRKFELGDLYLMPSETVAHGN